MTADIKIVGNATRDPELRFSTGGIAIAKFGVAVNRRVKNGDTWEDGPVTFFNVTAFRDLAENVAASIQKGMRVVVFGDLRDNSYENSQGEKVHSMELVAEEIAPSLRFATVTVERTERTQGGASSSSQSAGTTYNPDDEEPF